MRFTARFLTRLFPVSGSALLLVLSAVILPVHGQEDGHVRRTGVVTVHCGDDFERGRSETFVELEFPDPSARAGSLSRRQRVRFEGEPPEGVTTGALVRVRARPQGEELVVAAADGPESVEVVTSAEALVAGEQKTLVILVNFLDKNIAYTAADLQNRIFSSATSVSSFYRECSFGQVWLNGMTCGPYTINYLSTGSVDTSGWARAADEAATAAGIPVSTYPRRAYMLPGSGAVWSGLGTIGGNPSRCWVHGTAVGSNSVLAHELGHNLGMQHASTLTSEYGDGSDVMGSGLCHPNAPHKVQMGWVPSGRVLSPTASGTYTVSLLETAGGGIQAIRIPAPDGGLPYYVSFRKAFSFASSVSTTYSYRTSVHRWGEAGGRTFLQQTLTDGASFADPTGQFRVTQTAHTLDSSTVSISLPLPAPAPPTVAFTPASLVLKPSTSRSLSARVTNLDSVTSPASTFQLAPYSQPSGWSLTFNPTALTISAGSSATATAALVVPSGVPDGSYECVAQVADALQPLHTVRATLPVTVDGTAPTTPSNFSAVTAAYTAANARVDLSWTASTDRSGVSYYTVTRTSGGAVSPFFAPGTTYSDVTVLYGTTYTYGVIAYDVAGNASAAASVVVSTPASPGSDTTPPTCSVTSPLAGSVISGMVTVTATASDGSGIARVEFYCDGALLGSDSVAPYSVSWDSRAVSNGYHNLNAKAYDNSGVSASSSLINVRVDNATDTTGPTVAFASPLNGATVKGNVLLSVSASDASGVARMEFRVNGVLMSTDTAAPWSWTWNSRKSRGQTVTLEARAFDPAGNSGIASIQVRVP